MAYGILAREIEVEDRESFSALLSALQISWQNARQATAMHYLTTRRNWGAPRNEAAEAPHDDVAPHRIIFRPMGCAASSAQPTALELVLKTLVPLRRIHPASLSLSFDCELVQPRNRPWQLRIVDHGSSTNQTSFSPHRIRIMLDGCGKGTVWFDGHLLRRFGVASRETSK